MEARNTFFYLETQYQGKNILLKGFKLKKVRNFFFQEILLRRDQSVEVGRHY